MPSAAPAQRIAWVDTGRGLGMLIVFYAHFVAHLMPHKIFPAFGQVKFIYAWIMPFFFLFSGYMYRRRPEPVPRFVGELAVRRVVPFVFFNLVALGVYVATASTWVDPRAARLLVLGWPVFNQPMWFVSCLFTIELIYEVLTRSLPEPRVRAVAVLMLCGLGAFLTDRQDGDAAGPLALAWYWSEALVACGFYYLGHVLRGSRWLELGKAKRTLAALGFLGIAAVTFRANHGVQFVNMLHFRQGDVGWFYVTGTAGALGMCFTASVWPAWRWLTWIGRHSLVLLGLNGLVHTFLNGSLAENTVRYAAGSHLSVVLTCGTVVAASMLMCVPLAWALSRAVPQLVGQPTKQGPLLPALIRRPAF